MEKPPSKTISPDVRPEPKRTKINLVGSFILSVLVALVVGGIFQAISLPKACNKNPKTPIMKLEYQIQEDLTELTEPLKNVDAWLENHLDGNVKLFLTVAIVFLLLSSYYFMANSAYKESAIDTLGVSVSTLGGTYLAYMLTRDYFFQDSSEECEFELTKNLHIFQLVCLIHIVLLAFVAFQNFLTKNCGK